MGTVEQHRRHVKTLDRLLGVYHNTLHKQNETLFLVTDTSLNVNDKSNGKFDFKVHISKAEHFSMCKQKVWLLHIYFQ